VNLARVAWLTVVGACAVAIIILLSQDYYGYAVVTLAVGLSAAINLR
jgi:arginine/ornithine N-succinyltransferase beta subunit